MNNKQETIIDEMAEFRTILIGFTVLRKKIIMEGKKLTSEECETLASLFDAISIDAGKYGPLIKEVTGLETIHTSAGPQEIWNWALSTEANTLVISALDNCITATSKTIGTLLKDIEKGVRDNQGNLIEKLTTIDTEPPKAFIAHGGDSPALRKLKNFLESLGVQPLVVEEQASEDRSIGEKVNWYSKQADCALVLATKSDIDSKTGEFIPRGNVLMEIGQLQDLFKGRIIYLLQTGTKFPTNISEKVRARFSPQSMDNAFIKVARELTKFGILRALKP